MNLLRCATFQISLFIGLQEASAKGKRGPDPIDTLSPDNPMFDVLIAARNGASPDVLRMMLSAFYNPLASATSPAELRCFQALIASGLEVGNPSTYDGVYNDNSILSFAQTGDFVGLDQIREYLSFVVGGEFFTTFDAVGTPATPLFNFFGSTFEKCVLTLTDHRRITANTKYTDGAAVCFETVAGQVYTFTPKNVSPDPQVPPVGITIQTQHAYLPEALVEVAFSYLDTDATSAFVCDVLEQDCADYLMKSAGRDLQERKPGTTTRGGNAISRTLKKKKEKNCVSRLNKEAPFEGELNYIDGNTKGCRILHSAFAKNNPVHCPHVSFEADADVNGRVKCIKSKKTTLNYLFENWQLELFELAATVLFGLDETKMIKVLSC